MAIAAQEGAPRGIGTGRMEAPSPSRVIDAYNVFSTQLIQLDDDSTGVDRDPAQIAVDAEGVRISIDRLKTAVDQVYPSSPGEPEVLEQRQFVHDTAPIYLPGSGRVVEGQVKREGRIKFRNVPVQSAEELEVQPDFPADRLYTNPYLAAELAIAVTRPAPREVRGKIRKALPVVSADVHSLVFS